MKFKTFIYNTNSNIIHIFCIYGGNTPPNGGGGEKLRFGEKFFTVGIFRKNTPKCAKPMVEPYICDNLNQIYRYFSFLTKKILKFSQSKNRLEGYRDFVHVWLYFAGFEIVCSFLKLSCRNLYMVHASQKGRDYHTNLFIF